jgi:integrase
MAQPKHTESELERVLDGARLADTTRAQYKAIVRLYVDYAGRDARKWTPATCEAWLSTLHVEPQTKNSYLAALKRASRRWAGLAPGRWDFAAAVEGVVVPEAKHPRTPEPLDEQQLDAMLATCASDADPIALRDRCLLAVAIATGFRRRELAQIECGDLDHAQRAIVVVAKRGKRHRVKVSAQCWQRIEAWLAWLRRRHVPTTGRSRLFRALRRCLDAELSYCVYEAMRPETIWRIVRRRARQAGIRMRVTTHSLRHSTAAILRARGVPEERIARRLGHASVATTELYGRAGRETVHDVLDEQLPS